ncbi:anthranilate synthase component I [Enterococcus sp. CWB-B31]|uniref:anthranilate synthase component I n=1 Tax=Enterococcus sp. CWB-B31 TaxID=2885159 RepID=UPI001E4F2DFA|nr:anthranilate synthase component I [Enterococcus sp. CWB-B31]MCB5954920.1 anthranilate synthase component I [Enterococcus sp. CWB-B31]
MQKTKKLQADHLTAVSAFLRIQGKNKCMLESIPRDKEQGRHTIIAWNPVKEMTVSGQQFSITGSSPYQVTDPLKELEKYILISEDEDEKLPFHGGGLGYVGYDVVTNYEELGRIPTDELGFPDVHFYLFDSFLIFDHLNECLCLVESDSYSQRTPEQLEAALEQIVKDLQLPSEAETKEVQLQKMSYTSNFTKEAFQETVKKVKGYITKGDMFQMVPSQRLTAMCHNEPFDYYRRLRVENPSSYLYFIDFGETFIIGSSPERLVSARNGTATTNPIAGTRKRGDTVEEDKRLEMELLQDEKERAEHLMLIDLGRNDIGKISEQGTVEVPLYMTVEKYRFVMHIVSVVTGKMKQGVTAMDALKATLPAGTVSGAPKIRAMKRIYELEPVKRGIYAGAVGYLSKNDQADFAIAIRTMVIHKRKAYVQAGAGIVYDSEPEKEYEETLQKAKALLEVGK